jgi:hypothetical protein
MEKPYSELVEQAERAVSSVKNPELKRVAFEKILDDLLSLGLPRQQRESQLPQRKRRGVEAPHAQAKAKRAGPQAYLDELTDEGFFQKPKTISEVKAELENRGHHIPLTSLRGPLQKLCQKKKLRRQKAEGSGNKKTFVYSNW